MERGENSNSYETDTGEVKADTYLTKYFNMPKL